MQQWAIICQKPIQLNIIEIIGVLVIIFPQKFLKCIQNQASVQNHMNTLIQRH